MLEEKLNQAGIEYSAVSDVDEIQARGFSAVPVLIRDGEAMEFGQAVKWVNEVINSEH